MSRSTDERRIYRRGKRWWADFRTYSDVGGQREPLVPSGRRRATTSKDDAEALYDQRVAYYEAERQRRAPVRPGEQARIRAFAPTYLRLKADQTNASNATLVRAEQALRTALSCLTDEDGHAIDPWLHQFSPQQAGQVMQNLKSHVSPHTDTTLASRSQRYALDVLAELFRYAVYQGHRPQHLGNPVLAIPRRTPVRNMRFAFLDIQEAAAFIEALFRRAQALAARGYLSSHSHALAPPVVLSVILAYTGARPEEARSLLVRDVLRGRDRVRLRATKRPGRTADDDTRYVPLFPYARAVVEAYLTVHSRPGKRSLLCPTIGRDGDEVPIRDMRRLYRSAKELAIEILDEAEVPHELDEKRIVPRVWRPTYCTARAQTTDQGAPIALGTLRQEMGHQSTRMIAKVYERLGDIRPRGPHVECRLPDGRWPGEDVLREVLGDARFEAIVDGTPPGPGRRHLRLLK